MKKLFTLSVIALFDLGATQTFAQQKILTTHRDTIATNFFKRTNGVVAGDGGYTVALADGRSMWLFGDSFIDTYDAATKSMPCLFNVNNSAILQKAGSWKKEDTRTLTSDGPGLRSLFKSTLGEKDFYWPVMGIQLKDTVYVFCAGITLTKAGGNMGFAPTGRNSLAKLKYPEMTPAGYITLADTKGINFGVGLIKEGKYVYAYGNKFNPKIAGSEIYAARFLAGKPYGKWDYWDGKTWQADVDNAKIIGIGAAGTPQVVKLKNKYILVSSQLSVGPDQGTEIYTAVSSSPTGPFSERKKIHAIDDRVNGHSPFFYLPALHPQFIDKDGDILLTYSINGYGDKVEWCVNNRANPEFYRLQAIRVPMKLIDPSL
jgi:hypothetical protein